MTSSRLPSCTANTYNSCIRRVVGPCLACAALCAALIWPSSFYLWVCAGSFAGAVQTAIQTPVDVLKIRLQLQRAVPGMPGYKGPLAMLQHVVASEGLTGGCYHGSALLLVCALIVWCRD